MVKCCGRTVSAWHVLATAACCYWACFFALFLHSTSMKGTWHSPSPLSASKLVFSMFRWSPSVDLPSLSLDNSELIFSSVLERSADSDDLFVTSFFLSKAVLDPQERGKKVSVKGIALNAVDNIRTLVQKQANLSYSSNGARSSNVRYYCLVKLDYGSAAAPALIPAYFMPNRLTSQFHSNRKLDILRCPLNILLNSSSDFLSSSPRSAHQRNGKSLQVKLYREDTLLISFLIPWKTRSTGYLLSSPPSASQLEAWNGLKSYEKATNERDTIHLCVSNTQERSLYHLIEFLEHHKLIGVQHVYYSVALSWESTNMQQLLRGLEGYVREGFLTVQSSVDQRLDSDLMLSATEGIWWNPDMAKIVHINSCLYLAKGNAMYVGVWDLSDFFIPRNPLVSLVELLQKRVFVSSTPSKPFRSSCFLAIETMSVYPNVAARELLGKVDKRMPWLSSQYDEKKLLHSMSRKADLTRRFILPTENIFQGGLLSPGGCRVPDRSSCETLTGHLRDGFCFNNLSETLYSERQLARMKEHLPQSHVFFDDMVLQTDGSFLHATDEGGVLYSFHSTVDNDVPKVKVQKFRDIFLTSENQYGQYFSPRVESALNAKGYSRETLLLPIFAPPHLKASSMFKTWETFQSKDLLASRMPEPHTTVDKTGQNIHDSSAAKNVLPSFVEDYSDLCLGSLIERQHDSFQLHVSTFFLQHELLYAPPSGYGVIKLHDTEETKRQWKKAILLFNDTIYLHTGQRFATPRYFCRISVKVDTTFIWNVSSAAKLLLLQPYTVRGEFLPNSLTVDQNANRRVDILRCPLKNSELMHLADLPHSREFLSVDIYREKDFVKSFDIPWKTRRIGFSMSSPSSASKFDAWQRYPTLLSTKTAAIKKDNPHRGHTNTSDSLNDDSIVLHMCVPGFESPISQRSLTVYAEFLQHHFSLGVNHMFVAGPYAWEGLNMANFLVAFRSFIEEGVLSVSSLTESGEGREYMYSILGAMLDRDNVKIFHVTSCLFLSKGVADYVAVWDNDEFFVPRPPHHTIIDVIRASESSHPLLSEAVAAFASSALSRKRGRGAGWADGDDHPFCFLHLSSQVIYTKTPSDFDYFSPNRDVNKDKAASSDFIGDHFNHMPEKKRKGLAFQKSILPTRLIFQAGLHVGAACHLPFQWTHCNRTEYSSPDTEVETQFCYSTNSVEYNGYTYLNEVLTKSSPLHNFDSLVRNKDARQVSEKEAILYHVQVHRYHLGASAESMNNYKENDYTKYFFSSVKKELKRRHIFELLTTKNFQKFYESGSYWGGYLAKPDHLSSAEYRVSHQLLHTLPPAQGTGSQPTGHAEWLPFAAFYEEVSSRNKKVL